MAEELLLGVQIYLKTQLEEKGCSRHSYRYEPTFACSDMVFTSDKYWLRLETEKGYFALALGTLPYPPKNLGPYQFSKVCQFFKLEDAPKIGSGTLGLQLQELAPFLKEHWDEIFSPTLAHLPLE